jgi:hypothetical protein
MVLCIFFFFNCIDTSILPKILLLLVVVLTSLFVIDVFSRSLEIVALF